MSSPNNFESPDTPDAQSALGPPEWWNWSLSDWNNRLLHHYFEVRPGFSTAPVRCLVVVPQELARVTMDPTADPEDVRTRFLGVVDRHLKRYKRLLLADAQENQWTPSLSQEPPFFVHLVVTLLAASEVLDDVADGEDHGFHTSLRAIVGPYGPAKEIAARWERLRDWLGRNPGDWRTLELPNVGNWVHVGYSVRLAFPRAKQMERLVEVLHCAEISEVFAPPGLVLEAISDFAKAQGGFFWETYCNARTAYTKQDASLWSTPLWAAVQAALSRDATSGQGLRRPHPSARFQLVLEEADQGIEALLVADGEVGWPSELASLGRTKLFEAWGSWQYFCGTNDTASRAVELVLSQPSRLPLGALRWFARDGIIPFVDRGRGVLEQAGTNEEAALVGFMSRTAPLPTGARTTPVAGDWWFCRTLATQSANVGLSFVSLASIQLIGGTRLEPGLWFGGAGGTPRVRVPPGTFRVIARRAANTSDEFELAPSTKTDFVFPRVAVLDGAYDFLSFDDDGRVLAARSFTFATSPTREDYKRVTDEDVWWTEGKSATVSRSVANILGRESAALPVECVAIVALLGPNPGEFVERIEDAAWVVTSRGTQHYIHLGPVAQTPKWRSSSDGDRRRWRRLLSRSQADAGTAAKRSLVRGQAFDEELLTRAVASSGSPPRPVGPRREHSSIRTSTSPDELVLAVAAMATRTAGLPLRTWYDIVFERLGLEGSERDNLTRSWTENWLVDDVVNARWRNRRIWPRRPELHVLQLAFGSSRAIVNGLLLPHRRTELRKLAARHSLDVIETPSDYPFLPPKLEVSGPALDAFARDAGIEMKFVSARFLHPVPAGSGVERQVTPPLNYQEFPLSQWPGVKWCCRRTFDQPDYWRVDGIASPTWSYSRNLALLRARSAGLGSGSFSCTGDTIRTSSELRLPLPWARVAALFGQDQPGPRRDGWQWNFGNPALAADVARQLTIDYPGVMA